MFDHTAVVITDKFIEAVKIRPGRPVIRNPADIGIHRTGQSHLLRTLRGFVLPFPEGQNQRLDALPFFNVKLSGIRIERIKSYRIILLIRYIDTVLTVCPVMDHAAQSLIAVARVHQQDMRALFIILSNQVVGKKGFAAAAGAENKLVAVGDDTAFHRQVADVHMQGDAVPAVSHTDAERAGRTPVIGFSRKEADGLFQKGVERLFRRKITGIAGNTRPVEHRGIHRIVSRGTFHHGKLAARIVLYPSKFFPVFGPCHYVTMAADGQYSSGMGFIQIHLRPLPVYRIAPAVLREGKHVAGSFFHPPKNLLRVIYKHILRIDMVTGEQQSDGSGERKTAVATVCGHAFIAHIRRYPAGKVPRIRKGMHTQPFVTDAHTAGFKANILEHGGFILQRQGEIFLHQPGTSFRTGNLVRLQPAQADMPGIIHDTFELFHSFQKPARRVLVNHFLRQKGTAAECVKVTPPPTPFTGGLRQIQIAFMIQIRALVEMAFIAF